MLPVMPAPMINTNLDQRQQGGCNTAMQGAHAEVKLLLCCVEHLTAADSFPFVRCLLGSQCGTRVDHCVLLLLLLLQNNVAADTLLYFCKRLWGLPYLAPTFALLLHK